MPRNIKNACCHYCRVSKRRTMMDARYLPCDGCRNSYCEKCLKKHLSLDYEELSALEYWYCQCCFKECCCSYAVCPNTDPKHQHCFTYRRTVKRHLSHKPKWVKRKRPGANDFESFDCSFDSDFIDMEQEQPQSLQPSNKKLRNPDSFSSKSLNEDLTIDDEIEDVIEDSILDVGCDETNGREIVKTFKTKGRPADIEPKETKPPEPLFTLQHSPPPPILIPHFSPAPPKPIQFPTYQQPNPFKLNYTPSQQEIEVAQVLSLMSIQF